MLAQVLAVQGAAAEAVVHDALKPANLRALDISGRDTLIICFLDQQAARHARFAVRRLRRLRSSLRIGVVLWHDPNEARSVDREAMREEMQADFVACTMIEAVVEGLSEIDPTPLKAAKNGSRAVTQDDHCKTGLDRGKAFFEICNEVRHVFRADLQADHRSVIVTLATVRSSRRT